MSSTLVYSIKKSKDLPDELKWALEKRFQFPLYLSSLSVEYLLALSDQGVKGAQSLLELKEQFPDSERDIELELKW